MTKDNQKTFYKALGEIVKYAREAKGLTVVDLSKLSGEQNKTIRCIEKGTACSMHHLAWIQDELQINMDDLYYLILNYRESTSGEEKSIQEESSKENSEESISNLYDLI